MIYKFQTQNLIANPVEIAQQQLKMHQQKGTSSKLSIFEVARLMDTVLFTKKSSKNTSEAAFEICFN